MPTKTSSYLNILIAVGLTTYLIKNVPLVTFSFLISNQSYGLVARKLPSLHQYVGQNTLPKQKLHAKQSGFAAC